MPKKTLRLFEINFNCLQESSKRSSSVEATTISATLQATNALPEIHSSGNLIGKVHLWTVVWKEELNNEKIEHPPILRYCSFSPHSCHSPVSGVGFLAWKLWRTTLILEIWLNHSLPKKIVLVPPPPKKIFLSPSGDLGIGLVWHNLSGPHPTPPTFWSHCWNPLQTELNFLWGVLSCSQDDIRWF